MLRLNSTLHFYPDLMDERASEEKSSNDKKILGVLLAKIIRFVKVLLTPHHRDHRDHRDAD